MEETEKWHKIVWYFMGHAARAKTLEEKRRIVLAAYRTVDAAYADRARNSPRETDFETLKRFAEGNCTLEELRGAGRHARQHLGDFGTNPKLYGFATAILRIATALIEPDESADGGFSIRGDELPFVMGWLAYGRPHQGEMTPWEKGIGTALLNVLRS